MVKHSVILRGYQAAINDRAAEPVLVQRQDQEFIPGLLDGFRRKLSADELGRVRNGSSPIRLFQPVHRTFNLVLLEAVCDRPGSPRLNPRDIASAGFVVRRGEEGWLLRDERVVGWTKPSEPKLDPDPTFRSPRLNAGNTYLNGRLAQLHAALEPPAERVSRLFVAPPDVCAAAGRTLLYGLVPVTSSERSEEAAPVDIDPDVVSASMPAFLLALGQSATPSIADPISFNDVIESAVAAPQGPLASFMQELRLMHHGWRVWDSGEGAVILALLNQISLQFGDDAQPLGDYLGTLVGRFILRDDNSTDDVALPDDWPQPDAALADRIRDAAGHALAARLQEGVPNEQRFDDAAASYQLHAFIRVRCADGCPPVLQWAPPSAPFQIVPWWESGGAPLHTIALPDFDRESIKKVKPNIAFKVPPKLAAILNQTPDVFLKGKANEGGLALGWICQFSIPVITLCAFIVLNIFLVLLHIAFWWLFYIKICLPIPKPKS